MIQNPQVYYHFCMQPQLLICNYNIESSVSRIPAYYPTEVNHNKKQVKIFTARSIDNMSMLIYLLEFETPKNNHLHHRSLTTWKTCGLANYKKLTLLSFLYIASFTHLQVWYKIPNIQDICILYCRGQMLQVSLTVYLSSSTKLLTFYLTS